MTDSEQYKKELQDINSRLKKLIERWDRDGRPENPFEEPTVKESDPFLDNFPGFIEEVNEQTGKTEPKKCGGDKGIPCPCGKRPLSVYSPLCSPKKVVFCSSTPEECRLPESLRVSTFRALSRLASLHEHDFPDGKSSAHFPPPSKNN